MMIDPQGEIDTISQASAAFVPIRAQIDEAAATTHGHQTARRAIRLLLDKDVGFYEPTRSERDALLVGFAMHRRVLYGAAFDVIRLSRPVDLSDPAAIARGIDAITVYEIKSSNRKSLKADLKGYFFNITAAELLVAQNLGTQFRFAFVNTLTGDYQEMSLNEVFGRSRAMYPAWHIRF
jgi:hypothetical protein